MFKKIAAILFAISLVVAGVGCPSPTTETVNLTFGNKTGDFAYDFSLPDLNGEIVSLSALKGRPVVITFWSTT
jgi:cytochrome oxidase Cu insertion factor (SCO1/SenC/PrrC family)